MTNEIRMLSKNPIELFILKFELMKLTEGDIQKIITKISNLFARVEKKTQTNFEIKFTTDISEINKSEVFDYVLINEIDRFSLTFSSTQKAFWFETNYYIDNRTYNELIKHLIIAFDSADIDLTSKRIGMRYINKIKCEKIKDIKKYFNNDISKNLSSRAANSNISRLIIQEEFTYDDLKTRIQYGIPNKFYPAVLNNYDLLLDIDSFDISVLTYKDWENTLLTLNHASYTAFVSFINPRYLQNLI